MTGYTIGQIATAAGVPTSTVRFYERAGLLKPDFRTGGNYRAYNGNSLDRLKFIRSAQATGLSLADIESLLQLTFSAKKPCADVLALMQKRLVGIRERIRDLQHVEKVLAKSLKECCKGKGPDICDDIWRLRGPNSAKSKPAAKKCAACA